MEIQNGEYIRTKDGYIGKVTRFTTSDICYVKFYDNEEWKTDIEEAGIVKHSFNIIDLIEEGDYVNGKEIEAIDYDEDEQGNLFDILGIIEIDDDYAYYVELRKINIRTIVTKEQFKAMEYEVK